MKANRTVLQLILALHLLWIDQGALAEELHVAAASNFAGTIRKIAHLFETQTNHQVHLSLGSSGKLYAQIIHGAPFTVFLSADQAKPNALADQGYVAEQRTYALGKLFVWIPKPLSGSWQKQLLNPSLGKIAFANPRLAPYGAAAREVLGNLELNETESRWITGENIAQTFQFLRSGNAGAGFVAASQIGSVTSTSGLLEPVPQTLHSSIRQDLVLLKSGLSNPAAVSFYQFLQTPEVQDLISDDGYSLPEKDLPNR